MKHLSAILLFSIIAILNCAGPKQDDLSGLLLLLAGGPGNSSHCGQTVANPVDAGFTLTTNTYISNANNSAFVTAMGGNNCESAALVDNDNGTVTDTANHFLWTLCTSYNSSGTISKYNYATGDCAANDPPTTDDINITLAQAEAFCNSLTFAGHSDWVLPDAIQLFSLYSPTTPFALGSFGSKKSVTKVGAWSTTQTTSSHTIVHSYGNSTQRFFTTTASTAPIASFICVAKI
ncbi:DUF1566 domain-containing protein [Leptospira neocaledonica]|uniref:Lcl C-terminal domain-containing protein n=1 Tax=Leptospira neocaledonica TaxID=2023192 RepID=A0A2N0A3Z3_9LEPT|nr:DUF1566 domain-containing protein [Leptospira neocaledonica]PJZ79005.1 hypothetical protein CH365_01925 [Leptospira neocaledonica]